MLDHGRPRAARPAGASSGLTIRLRKLPASELPEWPADAHGTEVWRDIDGRVCAVGYRSGSGHALVVPGVGTFEFSAVSPDVLVRPLPTAAEDLVDDAYHRIAVPLALQHRGVQVLHASAVRFPRGIVALCGRAGTGKSTLAFALSRRGYELCADDAVAYDLSEDGIAVLPLPFRLRLRQQSADWFEAPTFLKGRERATSWQHATPASFSSLFVLDRTDGGVPGGVESQRLSPADAFTNVLPHAYYVDRDDAAATRALVTAYLELAERLPVFSLRYVPTLDAVEGIAAVIESEVAAL